MQQGLMFFGSVIGIKHVKWAANPTRAAGEILSVYVCEKTDDGSLNAIPKTITVTSEHVTQLLPKLQMMKQFDLFGCYITLIPGKNPREEPRMIFEKLMSIPGAK